MRAARKSQGFTLVEVMMAVAVITIGASGILMMQGATKHANSSAYELSVAINYGNTWIDRIKRDSLAWTTPGNPATVLDDTRYLGFNVVNAACADTNGWFSPSQTGQVPATESWAIDYSGWETRTDEDMRYCVDLRVTPAHVIDDGTAAPPVDALRVDVRVWWYRSGVGDSAVIDRTRGAYGCTRALTAAEANEKPIRTTYLSTVVRWNQT
jgi:type IV pilus assembly protein PilV